MTKEQILSLIRKLASSQGFYSRLYQFLSDKTEDSEEYLNHLSEQNFKDDIDLILYLEQ
jgi:hypothetical protein